MHVMAFSVPIYMRFVFENNITRGFVLTSVTLSISATCVCVCVERIGGFRSGRLRSVAERPPAKTTKTRSRPARRCARGGAWEGGPRATVKLLANVLSI